MATSNSSHQDDHSDRGFRRDIREVRREIRSIRGQYYYETLTDTVTERTHKRLQWAVLRYWDFLHEHADEKAVERKWKEYEIGKIPALFEDQVRVPTQQPGYGEHADHETQPAISQLSANTLWNLLLKLDKIAKELGFAPKIKLPVNDDADPI